MNRDLRRLVVGTCLLVVVLAGSLGCGRAKSTAAAGGGKSDAPAPPPRQPVVDEYHGVRVADAFRSLEDGKDPEVRAWSAEQNRRARGRLDGIPAIAAVRARLRELLAGGSPSYYDLRWAGGKLFAMKKQPPLQQPLLVVLPSADDPGAEAALVDPNQLDPKGLTAIDFYEPSRDGKRVAVSLSAGGSESGDVHVYDVAERRDSGDLTPRVNGGTAGGSVAWNEAGTGFYYTRYPRPGERPDSDFPFFQQVYFHKVGEPPANDRYELGRDFPRIAEIQLQSSLDGKLVLARVQNGDGGEFMHYLRSPGGRWVQLTRYEDRCVHAVIGPDDAVYFASRLGAPRGKVLRLPVGAAAPRLRDAAVIVPEATDSVDVDFAGNSGLWASRTRLFVKYQEGGPTAVKVFDLKGHAFGRLPAPAVSSVGGVTPLDGDDVLYRQESYLTPGAWFAWRAEDGASRRTKLVETSPADFRGVEVLRDTAHSADGTKVPVTVLQPRGLKHDRSNPALLYGYGGYGLSQTPVFRPALQLWLENGGVYAVANIRGGGEFGEEWHRAGALTRKQNVFDDFAAAAQHLVDAGYTRPGRLAIYGGSNGGLLMGAMITQHPELFRAVVSFVGVYDMLRVELTPNGAFNATEYGTVADAAQFQALYAYSPYHHVVDGLKYPAVLMLTGENDPRVEPWHSRKMAARLQQASASGLPILLRTSSSTGHGVGSALDETIAEQADMYAFLLEQVGVEMQH